MAIEVLWDDDSQTIVRFDMPADWGWEELHRAVRYCITHLHQETRQPADVIVDTRQTRQIPPGAMNHIRTLLNQLRHHAHIIVIVGDPHSVSILTIQQLTEILSRMRAHPHRILFASTLETARELITGHRSSSHQYSR